MSRLSQNESRSRSNTYYTHKFKLPVLSTKKVTKIKETEKPKVVPKKPWKINVHLKGFLFDILVVLDMTKHTKASIQMYKPNEKVCLPYIFMV